MSQFIQESVSVHLFDGSDPKFVLLYNQDNGQRVNYMTTLKRIVSFGTPVSKTADWIKGQISTNKIHIMRIVAHGDSGAFFLGKLFEGYNVYDWWVLRGCFDSAARIELHSCGVASDVILHNDLRNPGAVLKQGKFSGDPDGRGITFMRNLAKAVNVKVVASIGDHLVGSNKWTFFQPVTVDPYGNIKTDAFNPMVPD